MGGSIKSSQYKIGGVLLIAGSISGAIIGFALLRLDSLAGFGGLDPSVLRIAGGIIVVLSVIEFVGAIVSYRQRYWFGAVASGAVGIMKLVTFPFDLVGTFLLALDETGFTNAGGAVSQEPASRPRAEFELYEDTAGEWWWRLKHWNGNILADSGEGYSSRTDATRGIERLQHVVVTADSLLIDPAVVEFYSDPAGEWYWRLIHRNGSILAESSDGYSRRSDARQAIDQIRDHLTAMTAEVTDDPDNGFRWQLRSINNQVVAGSKQRFRSREEVREAVDRVMRYLPEADLLDASEAVFELYLDAADEWRWRLRHRNGNILADSGEGSVTQEGAKESINWIKQTAPRAEITDH